MSDIYGSYDEGGFVPPRMVVHNEFGEPVRLFTAAQWAEFLRNQEESKDADDE